MSVVVFVDDRESCDLDMRVVVRGSSPFPTNAFVWLAADARSNVVMERRPVMIVEIHVAVVCMREDRAVAVSVVDASLEERGELCLLEQFEYDISPLKVKLLIGHKKQVENDSH